MIHVTLPISTVSLGTVTALKTRLKLYGFVPFEGTDYICKVPADPSKSEISALVGDFAHVSLIARWAIKNGMIITLKPVAGEPIT